MSWWQIKNFEAKSPKIILAALNYNHMYPYKTLSAKDEKIASIIVQSALNVHKELGPGLLEKIYEVCFCYEIEKAGFRCQRQVALPIHYKEIVFNEGLRLDVLVEDSIICELKAVDTLNPIWEAQIISHLKLTGKPIGFLINFNVPLMKQGIKRYIA